MEQFEAVFVPFFGAGGGTGSSFRKNGWGRVFAGGTKCDGLTPVLGPLLWGWSLGPLPDGHGSVWAAARFAVLWCA